MSSAWTTDAFVMEDRRRVVSHPESDSAGLVERFRLMAELGSGRPVIEVPEVVAVRGERLAAVRIRVSFDASDARMESIGVAKFNCDVSRMERVIQLDEDDVDAALAELDRLQVEIEAEAS